VLCTGPDSWEQTLLECDIMSRNLHPSLMPLVDHKRIPDASSNGGTILMLMPLYRHGSLWDYVQRRHEQQKYLSGAEILSILEQVR
jgi:serine/threonine protein kinase